MPTLRRTHALARGRDHPRGGATPAPRARALLARAAALSVPSSAARASEAAAVKGAGILISSYAGTTTITGNTIRDTGGGSNGISAVNQGRGEGASITVLMTGNTVEGTDTPLRVAAWGGTEPTVSSADNRYRGGTIQGPSAGWTPY